MSLAGHDVALVIADLGGGGAQRVLSTLATSWTDAGRRVCVITLAPPSMDVLQLDDRVTRIALHAVGSRRSVLDALWSNLVRVRRLRDAIRSSGAPVIVSFIGVTNVLTVLATRGLGCRVVVSERNDPARQSLGSIWDRARRWAYRRADAVTATNADALATLAAWVPRDRLAVVPTPVILPTEPTVGEQVVLSVGRLHRQKGHDVLIRALAIAEAEGWRGVILGDGPERGALTSLVQELHVDVELAGHVDDPGPWYRRAGIFVLASRYEGVPNALLEALAHHIPAIVTDTCPGALELVEDEASALVVPGDDAEALARAIQRLVDDRQLRTRLGEGGRESVGRRSIETVLPVWDRVVFSAREHP